MIKKEKELIGFDMWGNDIYSHLEEDSDKLAVTLMAKKLNGGEE